MVRIIVGFVSAALVMPLIGYIFGGKYNYFWFSMILYFSLFSVLIFGVPLFYLNRKFINLKKCLIFGAVIGSVASLVLINTGTNFFIYLALFNFCGILSSFVFWVVAVRNNANLTKS